MNTKEKSQDDMKVKAESNPFKKPAPPAGHVTKKAKKQEKLPIKETLKNKKSQTIQKAKGSEVDERSNMYEILVTCFIAYSCTKRNVLHWFRSTVLVHILFYSQRVRGRFNIY